MSIVAEKVSYVYMPGSPFEAEALSDVSFTISDGEFVGIIGHTGSGKSTLVQHFNALIKPTSGKITVQGVDIGEKGISLNSLRQKVGLVFQYPEYQLFEETVEKDVAFGPKNLGLSPEEVDRRVRRAMEWVHLDYDRYAQRSPFELSGGQMRRVAIAGVLAMESKVLILDEPTAGLDPRGRDRILDMVKQLHAQGGVTVIMVSHSMDDISRLATRLIVMNKGRLVADGTPRELFRQVGMMESVGLGVPQATKLCALLRKRGIDIPDDLYTIDQVREHLLRLWKEAPHAQ